MKRSPGPRKTANLSESVHRQLNMYTLAASAAGVSLFALTQPAQAEIVYTPAEMKIKKNLDPGFPLDLNNDGQPDFWFRGTYSHYSVSWLDLYGAQQGQNAPITGVRNQRNNYAAALPFGVQIGSSKVFADHTSVRMASHYPGGSKFFGPWANGGAGFQHRYLGLKFQINGETHFGWARLKIKISNDVIVAYLIGYAYETVPNKPIIAGAQKGTDDRTLDQPDAALASPIPDTPQHATLGLLALGAPGLSIWRREESVAATPERN
jgi:hypothetical protein